MVHAKCDLIKDRTGSLFCYGEDLLGYGGGKEDEGSYDVEGV